MRLSNTVLVQVLSSCLSTGLFLWLCLGLGYDYVPYARIPSTKVVENQEAFHDQQQPIINTTPEHNPNTTPEHIPNTAHYVYILANVSADFSFAFSEVLSIYAASRYWQPDAIYLHTNAPAEALERARSGAAGKWTRLLFQVPRLHIVAVTVPTHAANGKEINLIEHKSDFVRVQALRDYGGAYLDFDVHPLRDIRVLRESGFHAVARRQQGENGEVNSGVFMNKPHSSMIELWSEGMHSAFTGDWSTHSNGALTVVCERLVASPPDVLIMERNAFAPGSWMRDDTIRLLEVHDDETSSLDMMTPDGHLPEFDEERIRWSAPEKTPRRSRSGRTTGPGRICYTPLTTTRATLRFPALVILRLATSSSAAATWPVPYIRWPGPYSNRA
ncbi:hypothetical protein BB8028_0006g03290 [Beauveria bassiana]|uniref:Glycosyl transferase n=1 Tax=Beauveria bassiana TaxID=176275 RepID=A0A2S7YIS7_BEABA|nr:hypothetical protein BB8028_0006g03290 [Beauveria bassiana]